jgi:predicted nuclease of predicted toxin-antitoxin system
VIPRLKVDEDLSPAIADLLNARGYDAVTVGDQGWQGLPDDELWGRIQAEGRWLVTGDKEFADLRRNPAGSHAGIILLRSREESRRSYVEIAAIAIDRVSLDEVPGSVIVATEKRVRIRRPLSS